MYASAPVSPSPYARGKCAGPFPFVPALVTFPEVDQARPVDATARVRAMVEQHFGFIWRYLRGLGISEAEADDVAQQVFITASSKIDVIDVGAERSFLVSTAHGVAANARRAVGRRREIAGGDGLDVAADPSVGAEQELETKEALALLDRFLASLSDDVREVFVLFELEGLTMAAIAADLRLAPGTVASRLRRAREQFQEMTRRFQAARERERR